MRISWEALAQDRKDRERSLITRLHNYKKETSSVSNFIKHFKGICDELAAIQKPVSNDDKVRWSAIGLGPKYMNFVGS